MATANDITSRDARIVAAAAVVLATLYVLWEVHIFLVLRNSATAFAELGMHLHEPRYVAQHVLPHLSLSGWAQSYFGGAPVGLFYFPLVPVPTILLSVLLPYNIAFKLVTASGVIALPAAAYAFGRLWGRDRLTSACLAVATLPYLLLPTTAIGGSISSTLSSEYPYAIGVAVSLLALGFAARGMQAGRGRAPAAGLLAAAFLVHVLPAAMAVLGVGVLVLLLPSWARLKWAVTTVVVAGLLAGLFIVPFVLRQQYSGGPVYGHSAAAANLLLGSFGPVFVAGLAGAILAVVRFAQLRDRLGVFLLAMAAIAAVAVGVLPTGRLWNARFLPFWYLFMSLLAGYAAARLGWFIDQLRRELARGRDVASPWAARMAMPVVLLLAVPVFWDSPLAKGLAVSPRYDVSHLTTLAYQGIEHSPDRAEYLDFVATARRVAREHGCGRSHWEWNVVADPAHPKWDDPRTGLAALLPYWTHECLSTMQGLFIQASPTDQLISAANGHLAAHGQPYDFKSSVPKLDVAAGVDDLRVLGVRYYFAVSPEAQDQADATPGLRLIDQTRPHGPWTWKVYEVDGARQVEPLARTPVVVPGASASIGSWKQVSTDWFHSGPGRQVVFTDGGPASWPRLKRPKPDAAASAPLPEVGVANFRMSSDAVSFDVSRTGVPVLVKVSYFPNWRASGAKGPYRSTPNWMVVVPTARHVSLRYQRTSVDLLGNGVTLLGLVGLVLLAVARPLVMPSADEREPEPKAGKATPPASTRQAGRRQAKSKPNRKRR
jgi:hypothetical protein